MPDVFYSALFAAVFPVYKALHTKRAYGRTVKHLANAKAYLKTCVTARDMFKGIFWNALDSYRGLARFKSVENRIVYENEEIIREAVKLGPVAGISIHQGAFELLHRALCRYSEHVHLITDSVGDQAFREVLQELRSDPHLTEYHPEETGFGLKSTLYLRLPQKVNQMGASVVTFRTWTEKGPEHRIVIRFEKFYPPRSESLIEDIAKETETWISEHPEQWSWNYHGNFRV